MSSRSIENLLPKEGISKIVLDTATAQASEKLKQQSPPLPILVVENERGATLIIVSREGKLGVYSLSGSSFKVLHHVALDKYRALLFEGCRDIRVFVLSKLLKCTFVRSSGCSIFFRTTLIGALEFFKCKQSDATLEKSLALVQVNSCDRIRFFHGPNCVNPVLYVINLSMDISCADTILVNTFDNLLTQRAVSVQTTGGPPILAGGSFPIYIQEISPLLFGNTT